MKVSVCIPVFNCEEYINDAITSVLSQTYNDFECIIIDNQSTDATFAIAESFKDARIKLFQNKTNIGFEANWNRCLSEASGNFIKILPADDFLLPNCLQRQVEIFENPINDHVVMVSCARKIVDRNGKEILRRGQIKQPRVINGRCAIRKAIRTATNFIGDPAAVLMRRETVKKVGKFDISNYYLIDLDYWIRMLSYGSVYRMNETLSCFRVSNKSESVAIVNRQQTDWINFISKIHEEKNHSLSLLDIFSSHILVHLFTFLRKIFYKFYL